MSHPLIRARDICQSFKLSGNRRLEVLKGISLDIEQGESVFLVGASGAGKTSLLYTLSGLERPVSGSVEFEGESLYNSRPKSQAARRNRRMGFIFQAYCLLPELTALENVRLPMMLARSKVGFFNRAKFSDLSKKAEELLTEVGLSQRLDHRPTELSGGEQQRVAIARAMANDPAIIFADEPTGNLDSQSGGAVMDLLLQLVREKGKTLLVVTHDLSLAAHGDRRLEMRDGKLVASTRPSSSPSAISAPPPFTTSHVQSTVNV